MVASFLEAITSCAQQTSCSLNLQWLSTVLRQALGSDGHGWLRTRGCMQQLRMPYVRVHAMCTRAGG
jgi:hypothetical protein